MKYLFTLGFIISLPLLSYSQSNIHEAIDQYAQEINDQVIEWRRDFHQYPELSNREFKTAEKIANHLNQIGLDVETGIAITGVVGLLDTGKPGPTIGLRADIDALPVTEQTAIPFASQARSTYLGQDIGVMHACGHNIHVAMLLGTIEILVSMKDQLKGKIEFVFQPAEEGAPPGEEGGAKLMVKEGLIEKYGIEVMFGQHTNSTTPVGHINYKLGGIMAAADRFVIKVKGKQSHGSQTWVGIDPVTAAAQIIQGLNNIVARQTALTKEAAVISVGKISGGQRNNIIPEEVELIGTIRTLDVEMQDIIHEKIHKTATSIAEISGATSEVSIDRYAPVTFNNLDLTRKMIGSLYAAAGEDNVHVIPAVTGAEDFSLFAETIPSFYFFTGGQDPEAPADQVFPHHTSDFFINERGLLTEVKAMSYLAMGLLISRLKLTDANVV